MKKPVQLKKTLEEIRSSKEYGRLERFIDPKEWAPLGVEERDLLALLFVLQGEKKLQEGDAGAMQSFNLANKISPNNPALLYSQAQAFSSSGNLSGEPQDFKNALSLYKKAASLGADSSDFWNDYAIALNEIARLINKPEMQVEAVEMLWKAIKLNPSNQMAWYNLAESLKILYQIHPNDAYFALSCESFEKLTFLEPHNAVYWIKWGELLVFRARTMRDIEMLLQSCKKFEAADLCQPDHPLIWGAWGEALLLLGAWDQDPAILKNALVKIQTGIRIQKDIPALWRLYGDCLTELGRYYGDEKFLIEAIQRYRTGLQICSNNLKNQDLELPKASRVDSSKFFQSYNTDNSSSIDLQEFSFEPNPGFSGCLGLDAPDTLLWYGLSLSLFTLGQLTEDLALIIEASQLFSKVIETGGQDTPQFWNDWGACLMKIGLIKNEKRFYEEAINKFEKALRLSQKLNLKNPHELEWLYNLGCAYEFLGDFETSPKPYEKALQLLRKVIEADPSFHIAYFNLACVYSRLGDLTSDIDLLLEANVNFKKVLENDPEDDYTWNEFGVSLLIVAKLMHDPAGFETSREYTMQAEKMFLQAIALGNISAIYHLACLYSMIENFEASIHYLEKCVENQALPSIDDLLTDDWLENVRNTPLFRHFISQF